MNAAGAPPVLSTTDLGLQIRGVTIVAGVGLDVVEGELLVIIGPNGAGKTTLFNLLSGVTRPTSGRVTFRGEDVTFAPPYVRARRGMGRTFQTSTIFADLSVLENVRLAAQAHLGGSDRIWVLADRQTAALERARGALASVGLATRERVKAASLSHGEKRKLDLAILLCGDPHLVLLDEPTAGIAVEDVPEMMELIRTIHRERGKTVLMVEHRMDLIMGLADRMAVMHHGALLAVDTPERIVANEIVQSAYLGDPL
ncbi:MAG TPA: ABC transporter ATP-binding protein [Candidatus Elarobacter sp.]|jgi:branched-chain amino acid transport system ATP-binding protein|nr:ABC transporter ATP-binding protein [Candidatus Elarobacter sp.]